MELKELEKEEVVKRNYEYLLLAQQNGFFQDGYMENDIATCSDWVITWWIDELGDKKKDKQKFLMEILPNFKRWFSNGVCSNGVGMHYEILKMAERMGIKIDANTFSCISILSFLKNIPLTENSFDYQSMLNHFERKEIIDHLLELEEQGEIVNYDTFTFLRTAESNDIYGKKTLYERKKDLEKDYHYYTCNADEVEKLYDWIEPGGYNFDVVRELEKKVGEYRTIIFLNKKFDQRRELLSKKMNQKITLHYYLLEENEMKHPYRVNGKLVAFDDQHITLEIIKENGEVERSTFDDEDCIISHISSQGTLLYQCKTVKEKIAIQKITSKIKKIKEENLLDRYLQKFGTIEGLAYLKKFASPFILVVDEKFPVDNLFTFCFECISGYSFADSNKVLQYTKLAYDKITSGEFESIGQFNYGYPINKFLSEDALNLIEHVCRYVVTSNLDFSDKCLIQMEKEFSNAEENKVLEKGKMKS